jgi:5'-3' exonuclease
VSARVGALAARDVHVHLLDGTYELFRAFYGPGGGASGGSSVGGAPMAGERRAVRALVRSLVALLRDPEVTHVAVAFDSVIESFRNGLYAGYKTGDGVDPALRAQFAPAEEACRALGVVVWPMVEFEADDALATFAARAAADPRVTRVHLCSPDKDLAQCVRGQRVVRVDRMRGLVLDEDGVRAKYGVGPASIPDLLALVGDSADGIPGIPRWGARSAAAVLAAYGHLEAIPDDAGAWTVRPRGADTLAAELRARRAEAALYKRLATLREDVPLAEDLDALRWRRPAEDALARLGATLGDPGLPARLPATH